MLYPSIRQLMNHIGSRYLLVNVAAARAREIADFADRNEIPLSEKPVKIAIGEISEGKLLGRVRQDIQL